MILPGTYHGKIMNWGIKWFSERDEYKAFITFEIENESEQTTWFGSLDQTEKMGKTGTSYSFYNMTMRALKNAGFKSDDPSDLIATKDALEMGKMFAVTLTKTLSKDGTKEYTNTTFEALNADGSVAPKGKGVVLESASDIDKVRAKLGIHKVMQKKTGTDNDIPF